MTTPASAGGPWYQYFWPWFIVILLAVSVLGSLATVYVAFINRDEEITRTEAPRPRPEIDHGG